MVEDPTQCHPHSEVPTRRDRTVGGPPRPRLCVGSFRGERGAKERSKKDHEVEDHEVELNQFQIGKDLLSLPNYWVELFKNTPLSPFDFLPCLLSGSIETEIEKEDNWMGRPHSLQLQFFLNDQTEYFFLLCSKV